MKEDTQSDLSSTFISSDNSSMSTPKGLGRQGGQSTFISHKEVGMQAIPEDHDEESEDDDAFFQPEE